MAHSQQSGSGNQIRWLRSDPGVEPTGAFSTASLFAVEGTAVDSDVPEPGTAATALAALAGILGWARVRRARR